MRCFIAVELPTETQQALCALQQELAAQLERGNAGRVIRWTPPESIHLTLRFLGETSDRQAREIVGGLHAAAACAPITLTLQGVGCFPTCRRPNVVWAGVAGAGVAGADATLGPLRALQRALEESARAAGFEPEDRPFTPHLTLGRVRRVCAPGDLKRAGAVLQEAALLPTVQRWSAPLRVEAISLMHSDLRPTGAVYTALERIPLCASMQQ